MGPVAHALIGNRFVAALVAIVGWLLALLVPLLPHELRERAHARRARRAARPQPTRYARWNVTDAAERWRRRWNRATWL